MGLIFDIQRCSLHDGPGIRTSVFLKGCPLHCLWCHNPESQSFSPELGYYSNNCTNCGRCVPVCQQKAQLIKNNTHSFDRTKCNVCGACATVCPNNALKVFGKYMSVKEVMEIVLADKSYYNHSDGGLTASGGEPLAQHTFLMELLKQAHAQDIHTCIETSGFANKAIIDAILPYVDLFLYDYKATDENLERLTGARPPIMIENLKRISNAGKPVILRCPIIPGYNDTEEHFNSIVKLKKNIPNIQNVEIMPYHDLGLGKYTALGRKEILNLPSASQKQIEQWKALCIY